MSENEKRAMLSREFRDRHAALDSLDLVASLYGRIEEVCPDALLLERITSIELQHRLPELLLMRVDKMTMATSVETRVPFLHCDLVEMHAILREDREELEPYFDLSELARRLDGPLTTVNQSFQLWVAFNLAVWRRSFFA